MNRTTARFRANVTEEKMVSRRDHGSIERGICGKEKLPSKMAGIPQNASSSAAPLEISDDDSPWKNMDVRSSEESHINFLMSKQGLTIITASLILFLVVLFAVFHHESSGSHIISNNGLVAPIYGQAFLAPDEFRDIRTAHPEESVLITGGLGFIGSHVVDLLLHRGFKVTILDDESNGHNHNLFAKEMVPKDITVVGDLPKFPTGENEDSVYYTHVIHLAAAISVAESMTDSEKYERINYGGSQKVLNWINDYNRHVSSQNSGDATPSLIRKLVAASSAAIYGDPDPALLPLQESAPYGGLSPYADTKYRMEGLMRDFVAKQNNDLASSHSIPPTSAVALRFFNVFGPRQDPKNPYSGVMSLFLEMAMTGQDITILGDGEMTRDFVYVKDVARAIVLALLQEQGGNNAKSDATFAVYNVCTGKTITINTLAEQVKQSMQSRSKITHVDPREGDIRASSCNPNGVKDGIGFVSAVSQEGGLEKTAKWFRAEEDSRKV
mmetsp:Transcript_36091/g.66149  ORF Transcript_36091/g.66149 Transcript_36091/m.66149 type:complete len:497 (+) Transcript_36091:188-1678(+)